ncbi:uncharacterized protein LOC110270481 isoform X2 [Arachis ipaensis]|uniref:uncharacterized protein n=1 Tax=Arachis hypogaea TaxID=3818 RepID=UPI000A2B7A8B|nr:uncharacterized protein LOC110270481 isoform X2 [Arachis ipaensis]
MELLAKVETGIICFGMFMSATSISDRDKSPICLFEESHPVVSHAAHLEGIYSNFSSIFRPTPMLPQYAPGCLPPWRPKFLAKMMASWFNNSRSLLFMAPSNYDTIRNH